jgi:hypothetical protein
LQKAVVPGALAAIDSAGCIVTVVATFSQHQRDNAHALVELGSSFVVQRLECMPGGRRALALPVSTRMPDMRIQPVLLALRFHSEKTMKKQFEWCSVDSSTTSF